MNKTSNKYYTLLIYIVLTLATIIAFEQVRHHEFLNYDDGEYVTANNYVQSGLTWQNIRWAFTTTVSNHWHPLTWLSHMLDCRLFGLNSAAHHLTNLLLHIVSTLLLFSILRRTTTAIWQSAFVAALFALHPLHVESVAWVAERKDVLSTLFWMLTMAAYLRYVKRPCISWYLLTLLVFALGLMAKPMLVTIPLILLLLDYWPLDRIRFTRPGPDKKRQPARGPKPIAESLSAFNILLEKIPFFILAAASAAVTIIVMKHAGHVAHTVDLTFKYRIANVLVSYAGYILKMFWPSRLAPFYPHPGTTLPIWKAVAAAVVLLLLSVAIFYHARRRRYLLTGWLWYLITLLPVIGLLQVGSQAQADRYTYVPLIGLFIIIPFAAADLLRKLRYGKFILSASAAAVISVLMVCTYQQVGFWRNSITLFEHTIRVTDNNYLAHNNLANALGKKGQYDAAIVHGLESLRIRPEYDIPHYNLGMAFYHKGDIEKAVSHWTQTLQFNPKHPDVHYNLAVALLRQNEVTRAIEHLKEELKLNPNHARARKILSDLQTTPPAVPSRSR